MVQGVVASPLVAKTTAASGAASLGLAGALAALAGE